MKTRLILDIALAYGSEPVRTQLLNLQRLKEQKRKLRAEEKLTCDILERQTLDQMQRKHTEKHNQFSPQVCAA